MTRRIVIDPVTRIEGHAKITVELDDADRVVDARFHVGEFRGFERFCVGRPFWEMPALTARICGICPVSHLLVSAKAGDRILAVEIPPAAVKLRRLSNLGQIIQSHALSFFHLSSPDLLLGMDAPPRQRNLFAMLEEEPEFVRGGIRLRKFGQEVIERLGGRRIHAPWAAPGGVVSPLSDDDRAALAAEVPDMIGLALAAIDRLKSVLDRFQDEMEVFGNTPSLYLALVRPEDGGWEHYDGWLRLVGPDGETVVDRIDPARYREYFAEAVQEDSYLKSPYYRPRGPRDGCYRVGPLARLNVCTTMGVDRADAALAEYRARFGRIVPSSFLYHYARLIEILASIEWIERSLEDPELLSGRIRADAGVNRTRGVGVGEAPRGTLFHEYEVDDDGLLRSVNLLIATGQNNLAMNQAVAQIARRYITGPKLPEGILNRLEAGIRAFDPCLSCSTHALGDMPMILRLIGPRGELLDELRRAGER